MKRYYTFTVETLSPVHIGSSDTYTKIDYIYSSESRTIYIMDMHKLIIGMDKLGLLQEFQRKLDGKTALTEFAKKHNISEDIYSQWQDYSYKGSNAGMLPKNENIHSFIKDAYGIPYIPGSSLKGMIRNVAAYSRTLDIDKNIKDQIERVFADKINNTQNAYSDRDIKNINRQFNNQLKASEKDLITEIFHTLNRHYSDDKPVPKNYIVNDCFSGLIISDSKPLNTSDLTICKKTDIHLNGDPKEINLYREALKPGTKAEFEVSLDDKILGDDAEKILKDMNLFYNKYSDAFKNKFEENYCKSPNKNPVYHKCSTGIKNNQALCYLGGGVGFPARTVINSLYNDDFNNAADKTAEILDQQFPSHEHKTFTDQKRYYSPSIWKCTVYNNMLYEMGLCKMTIKERNT